MVDGRNFLDREALREAGFTYEGIGQRERVQALVLAGGEGTRLRPLTLTTPKPVMPLAGRPFLVFMLDWLRGHGVDGGDPLVRLPLRRRARRCSATSTAACGCAT